MITNPNGEALQIVLQDPSAGILRKEDGVKVLVFIDRASQIQVHIPMTDEQEQSLHETWNEKHVIVVGADHMPPDPSANGHSQRLKD